MTKKQSKPQKKKKPTFNVPNLGFFKSVKARWRKPRGVDNKKRIRKKFFGALPRVGYKNTSTIRGNHPRGMPEVLVHNETELNLAKEQKALVRFSATLGKRKLIQFFKMATEAKLEVLNPPKPQKKGES